MEIKSTWEYCFICGHIVEHLNGHALSHTPKGIMYGISEMALHEPICEKEGRNTLLPHTRWLRNQGYYLRLKDALTYFLNLPKITITKISLWGIGE